RLLSDEGARGCHSHGAVALDDRCGQQDVGGRVHLHRHRGSPGASTAPVLGGAVFSLFKDADNKEIESHLDAMLADCMAMIHLDRAALFGDRPASEVQDEIWGLDKQVNRRERAVRRELLVRGAVRHAEFEQGLLLAYMSVAKDLERIGDYCKNIW